MTAGPEPIELAEKFTGVLDDLLTRVIRDQGDLATLRNRAAVEVAKIALEERAGDDEPRPVTQEAGEARRQVLGIDGTMGDAQDVPHGYVDEGGAWASCLICGLARGAVAHAAERRAGDDEPHPDVVRRSVYDELVNIATARGNEQDRLQCELDEMRAGGGVTAGQDEPRRLIDTTPPSRSVDPKERRALADELRTRFPDGPADAWSAGWLSAAGYIASDDPLGTDPGTDLAAPAADTAGQDEPDVWRVTGWTARGSRVTVGQQSRSAADAEADAMRDQGLAGVRIERVPAASAVDTAAPDPADVQLRRLRTALGASADTSFPAMLGMIAWDRAELARLQATPVVDTGASAEVAQTILSMTALIEWTERDGDETGEFFRHDGYVLMVDDLRRAVRALRAVGTAAPDPGGDIASPDVIEALARHLHTVSEMRIYTWERAGASRRHGVWHDRMRDRARDVLAVIDQARADIAAPERLESDADRIVLHLCDEYGVEPAELADHVAREHSIVMAFGSLVAQRERSGAEHGTTGCVAVDERTARDDPTPDAVLAAHLAVLRDDVRTARPGSTMTSVDIAGLAAVLDLVDQLRAVGEPRHEVACPQCSTTIRARMADRDDARGMTIDGDLLADIVVNALPRVIADHAGRDIAEQVLDDAVTAGFRVLQGVDGTPRRARSGGQQDGGGSDA